jgi:hypothetical protein
MSYVEAQPHKALHEFCAAWQRQGHEAHIDLLTPQAVRRHSPDGSKALQLCPS